MTECIGIMKIDTYSQAMNMRKSGGFVEDRPLDVHAAILTRLQVAVELAQNEYDLAVDKLENYKGESFKCEEAKLKDAVQVAYYVLDYSKIAFSAEFFSF